MKELMHVNHILMYNLLVMLILQIPSICMRALLTHYNWDKERLLERFYEFEGNQDRIFKDAHIINPFKKPKLKVSNLVCNHI